MVVAIDGPAGVGKSTIASMIAEKLKMFYLNSGNFYRAITWKVLESGVDPEDNTAVIKIAEENPVSLENGKIHINGVDINDKLHLDNVDKWVAQHSAIIQVRHIVNKGLRETGRALDLIVEGRDITTVVFPDAELKLFLDASIETRAGRRFKQGVSGLSLKEITAGIENRDHIDKNKAEGSLKIAADAEYLDTSDLTIEQVCEKVTGKITRIINNLSGEIEKDMIDKEPEMNKDEQISLQEEYLKTLEGMEEGQLINGKIIEIGPENVFLDVGYKSEGKIPVGEFKTKPKIGDTVGVVLVKKEGKSGEVIVSKNKADVKILWKDLRKAHQENLPVEGVFEKSIKGGFEVDLGFGITAFTPLSKTDVVRVENPEDYVGMTAKFLIDRLYSDNKIKIVLSRRNWLENEISAKRDKFFSEKNIDDEITGEVKSFTSFGAFIDLGGFDGLLHINDMSWGHVTRPKDYVKKGQKIKLKIIRLDAENKKINLSLKHFTPDPWSTFEQKYQHDDIVNGKVTKLTDFGAFIEIEEGIEGLAHISELSWVKRVKHPKELLSVGDEVEAMILAYDLEQGRISLGLKQVLDNPWDNIEAEYPVGKRFTKKIVKITNAGAFIELDEGIDGFLHVDDISWTKRIKHPSTVLKQDEEIEVVIIDVDNENNRIRLGVKQLSEDPWKLFKSTYPRGSVIDGEITSITDFGIFVRVPGEIEGLINKQNLDFKEDESNEDPFAKYKTGEKIKAVVTEVNIRTQRLSLSVKEYQRSIQKEELSKYIHDGEEESTFTLGHMLSETGNDSGKA